MHAVISLTLMHDRYLAGTSHKPIPVMEAFHWQQSLQKYICKISNPLQPSDVECICATGAIMCALTFSNFEAQTPWEAWPLASPSPQDLNWLKMGEGKQRVLELLERIPPLNRESAFVPSSVRERSRPQLGETSPSPGLDGPPYKMVVLRGLGALPYEMITLCGLDAPTSSLNDNPYYHAASLLAAILDSENKNQIIVNSIEFITSANSRFQKLLEAKDPRSLLLLAYWYAKHIEYPHWWVYRRAKLECQAICIYLDIHHCEDIRIQSLLQYPRIMSGSAAC